MGCSNARLLVSTPADQDNTNNPIGTGNLVPSSSIIDEQQQQQAQRNTTTRMHLNGVDLVVERNGSYTLLLTPKTHKQLMPYVVRKKKISNSC